MRWLPCRRVAAPRLVTRDMKSSPALCLRGQTTGLLMEWAWHGAGVPCRSVTGIQPELWPDHAAAAVAFYQAAFGAGSGAGATATAEVADEHGWRLGRIIDPFGHEWEIGTPLGPWPPG